MKGVLLAAGKGTRMLPLTEKRPKPLVPVLDRPILEHIILGARDAGVDHFGLIVGHLGAMIEDYFGDGRGLGVRIDYIWQQEAKGTGHAALLAEEFVAGDVFFMSWGDIMVSPRNYTAVVGAFEGGKTDAVLSLNWVQDPCKGAAVYVKDGLVEKIIEKPDPGTSTTNYNNAGLFVYTAELFDRLRRLKPSARGELELPDAVQEMVREGKRIAAVPLEGYWSDVADPAAVIELNATMLGDRYEGGLYVDRTAQVSPEATLEAPYYVGPSCVVEGGAHVGPNAVLQRGCTVKAGAHFSEAALLTGARVGGRARVRYCLVEEDAHVGEGEEFLGERRAPRVVQPAV